MAGTPVAGLVVMPRGAPATPPRTRWCAYQNSRWPPASGAT